MVDIAGTKKRIQRLMNVAEESYKKVSEVLERMEKLQNDLESTSEQVDHIEYDLAEQRALLEAIANAQDLDVDEVLADADLPEPPTDTAAEESGADEVAVTEDRPEDGESSETHEPGS